MNHNRPRILCIPDGPDWIFNRHIEALNQYLGELFDFHTIFRFQAYDESTYDLIYPLEFDMVRQEQILNPAKYITGIRSFVSWADWNFLDLVNYVANHFQSVHVVSQQLFGIFSPYIPGLSYVTHGVDATRFSPSKQPTSEAGQLRLGWAGNRNTIVKGFRDFIEPLGDIPGVELVYHGYIDHNLPQTDMPGFYDSLDAYVSASKYEGNNNTLLEAAAMGRPIITTSNGTVPEYLVDEQSALVVERNLDQLKAAVFRLRDDPGLRQRLGQQARKAILQGGWDWQVKAEEYRTFFESALSKTGNAIITAPIVQPSNYHHYASVLEIQFDLERELRIGYAYRASDLNYTNKHLQEQMTTCEQEREKQKQELIAIKESRTYKLVNRLKDSTVGRWFSRIYRWFVG